MSDKPHLTLLDLSDRELLLILRDVRDAATGYATSADIAAQLGLGEEGKRNVSVRLSWLTRYGAVEPEYKRDEAGNILYYGNGKPKRAQGWALTDIGFKMATGTLTAALTRSLDNLDEGRMLLTVRALTKRMQNAGPTASKLMDREYRHGVGKR